MLCFGLLVLQVSGWLRYLTFNLLTSTEHGLTVGADPSLLDSVTSTMQTVQWQLIQSAIIMVYQ